jgi:hypothetical protein
MRVLVCGAAPRLRKNIPGWTDREAIKRELEKLPTYTVVIEGEALGADILGKEVALELGFEVDPYPAKWSRYGRGAGPIRNRQMLDKGKPDLVLAFHTNIQASTGTKHMVKIAREAGVEVRVFAS